MARSDLTEGPVWRALARVSAPMSLGILAVLSIGLADAYFLGQLGGAPLAAVGFIYPVTTALASLAIGLSAGANAAVSQALGREDEDSAVARMSLHAAGLGLLLPGAGFIALGGWYLLLLPLTLGLFWLAVIAWFWAGMVVAPLGVWLGAAALAGALAGPGAWPPAAWLAPAAAAAPNSRQSLSGATPGVSSHPGVRRLERPPGAGSQSGPAPCGSAWAASHARAARRAGAPPPSRAAPAIGLPSGAGARSGKSPDTP